MVQNAKGQNLVLTLFPGAALFAGSGCVRMQDAEVRNLVLTFVSKNCFIAASSGCCACSKYAMYYGALIGIDALILFFQNCFDFSFDWTRPCVLYLLLSKWGWL